MNEVFMERRGSQRQRVTSEITFVCEDGEVPARLLDLSFTGLQALTVPGALEAGKVQAVRLDDLPELAIGIDWMDGDMLGAHFKDPMATGKVIAGFLELFLSMQKD